ncbi:MAG: glycosyltransferase family 4 protein [Actinopolymorphaceae bacterium]
MRILSLTLEYPPDFRGGLGRHVQELARALTARNVEVHVALPGKGGADGKVRIHGGDMADGGDPGGLPRDLRMNLAMVSGVAAATGPWDVLHAHDWMVAPAACALARATGTPVVATIHADVDTFDRSDAVRSAQRLRWEADLAAAASHIIVCGTAMRRVVAGRYPERPVVVIPGGVNAATFTTTDCPRDRKLLVFFGRLVPAKGCQDLLAALALLRRQHSDLRLNVIGDGWYRGELERVAAEHGLDRGVAFLGRLAGAELARELGKAAVVVLPSHVEPFGLVGLEAMAAGAPVVASEVGGFAEYITHQQTGLLTRPRDPSALAASVNQLLRRPRMAQDISRRALTNVVPHFSWHEAAIRTRQVYDGVTSGG